MSYPQGGGVGGGVFTGRTRGVAFNPNIPTEECFTRPKKGIADGIVYASLPLFYQGALIENFWMRFEGGKVVEAHAEKNDERLQKMITMDEGTAYLGECALVPFDSPINQSGLLFYNTLFDENACCHFALGRGFNECVKDGLEKTKEELSACGVNDSIIHVDFMIGTSDISITGKCKDGKEIQIFKDGPGHSDKKEKWQLKRCHFLCCYLTVICFSGAHSLFPELISYL